MSEPTVNEYTGTGDFSADNRWGQDNVNTLADNQMQLFWQNAPKIMSGTAEIISSSSGVTRIEDTALAGDGFNATSVDSGAALGDGTCWVCVFYDEDLAIGSTADWKALTLRANVSATQIDLNDSGNFFAGETGETYDYFITYDYAKAMADGHSHNDIDSHGVDIWQKPWSGGVQVDEVTLVSAKTIPAATSGAGNVYQLTDEDVDFSAAVNNHPAIKRIMLRVEFDPVTAGGKHIIFKDDQTSATPSEQYHVYLSVDSSDWTNVTHPPAAGYNAMQDFTLIPADNDYFSYDAASNLAQIINIKILGYVPG